MKALADFLPTPSGLMSAVVTATALGRGVSSVRFFLENMRKDAEAAARAGK